MANAIRSRDLRSLSQKDRERAAGELVDGALEPVNGQAMVVKARIREFESRYEMTSAQLATRLREGTFTETAEIAEWLFWLRVQGQRGG